MTPGKIALPTIYRGIDWICEPIICSDNKGEVPKDLTGYTSKMELRTGYDSDDSTLIATVTTEIDSFTDDDGTWYYVKMSLTDAVTGGTALDGYDEVFYGLLLIDSDGISYPWMYGRIPVSTGFPVTES